MKLICDLGYMVYKESIKKPETNFRFNLLRELIRIDKLPQNRINNLLIISCYLVVVVSTGVPGAGIEVVSGVGTVSTSVVTVVESVISVSLVSGACLHENAVKAAAAKNNARNVVVIFIIR